MFNVLPRGALLEDHDLRRNSEPKSILSRDTHKRATWLVYLTWTTLLRFKQGYIKTSEEKSR